MSSPEKKYLIIVTLKFRCNGKRDKRWKRIEKLNKGTIHLLLIETCNHHQLIKNRRVLNIPRHTRIGVHCNLRELKK